MKYKLLASFFLWSSLNGIAQFKNDNVLYTTVDPTDLCKTLEKSKGYLLLDVRSPGEHYDTSQFVSLNIGRLKGAKNIEVQSLATRWKELENYKDRPIFIYCSHSQRSRRASKMLADSGFTKIYNINGGLSAFHYNSVLDKNCINSLYETSNKYSIISFNQLCQKANASLKPYIIDVRPDSAFRHISRDAKTNAQGTIKGSVSMPLSELKNNLGSLPAKNREILIIDQNGNDAAKAAVILSDNGFQHVSILVEGVDRVLSMDSKDLTCKKDLYISPLRFKTLSPSEFGTYTKTNSGYQLIDIRTADEFVNIAKDSWRNIGHLTGSSNIPEEQLKSRFIELDKNKDVLLYGFSSGGEVYRSAEILRQNGFAKIYVLTGGIFNTRWAAANVKGQEYLKSFVVDIPEANQ